MRQDEFLIVNPWNQKMLKRIFKTISLILLISTVSFPQLAKDSWSLGFGVTYPRLMSISSSATGQWSGIGNYGGYINLQRSFSEHVGLRFIGNFSYMETEGGPTDGQSIYLLATDFDLMYYLVPCEVISPFFLAGFGAITFNNDNSPESWLDVTYVEYQFNLGIGAEWRVSDNWSIRGEGVYHSTSTNKLDGYDNPGEDKGLFGSNSDTYITLKAGVQYYFSKGEPSPLCDLYDGIRTDYPTLDEIEDLIKKYACKEVIKEVVVEKPVEAEKLQWVLVGVNFEFDRARLTEGSYPILYGAVQYLNNRPDLNIEIQGHTDYIGSDSYNQDLSERRATTVRDYLVAKGIDSSRLTIKGYGESVPIADNTTAEGRALNRRIEFKVTNK
jgi:OOP family OmpA-OmpF porin